MKKFFLIILLISLFICEIYAFVFPTAKVVLNENNVSLGEVIPVTFEITVPSFVKFIQDENRFEIDGWEIKNVSYKRDYREKGKYIINADIVTYDPDIKQIPAVKFFYTNKDFNYYEEFSFFSEPLAVNVTNLFPNDSFESIRDVKNPKEIAISKMVYFFIFLFFVFVLFFVYKTLFVNKIDKRIQINGFSNKEIAIRKINKLLQDENFSSKDIKNYYFCLSDIFKEFILNMQNINNVEMTTQEIVELLKKEESCFFKYNEEIEKIFKDYDFVKYSGTNINNKDFVEIFAHTKNIIERY